jgi:lipopolysaccharide transport system ATP-binding protein
MFSEPAISVDKVSKCYQIYESPRERLKQFLLPRARRLLGRKERNHYREFWALHNVSLTVNRGETVGIVGKNGSGKSTLLQIICGTLGPSAGNVAVRGRVSALLELGTGFNSELSGRENVYISAAIMGMQKSDIDARLPAIEQFADIGDFIDQPVKTYSSGMFVRLAFALAVNVDPDILIIDEALSVGDELFQRKCFARIEEIKKSGATVLFVSHAGSLVVSLCDRALLIDEGELLDSGNPKTIIGAYQKLLYADQEQRAAIRQQIREGRLITNNESSDDSAIEQDEASGFYDPTLASKSQIDYQRQGARIENLVIRNTHGDRVNHLQRGHHYELHYIIHFDVDARDIIAGMMIKTATGVELGGIKSHARELSGLNSSAGGTLQVSFRFQCNLAPGVYFINTGVVATRAGERTFLHRILDAVAFRVSAEEPSIAAGLVDFQGQCDIHELQSQLPSDPTHENAPPAVTD